MKRRIVQLVLGVAAFTAIAISIATVRPATTFAKSKAATCKAYDRAEFALLTGIDSEYGGMLCVMG
jgi:hypothetical protein